jgi:predicted nucleotidyltransferase
MNAGLTQSELGTRAGVAQSVVSAYESGHREPALETVRKLVRAAGFELNVTLNPVRPSSHLRKSVFQHRRELRGALEQLGASNIRLFGSVARGDDGPASDVDLLIDVNENVGMFALGQMRGEAERILGVAVDVVPASSLKHELAPAILRDAVAL